MFRFVFAVCSIAFDWLITGCSHFFGGVILVQTQGRALRFKKAHQKHTQMERAIINTDEYMDEQTDGGKEEKDTEHLAHFK